MTAVIDISDHLPLRYEDTADYCEVYDKNGEKVALTTRPELFRALERSSEQNSAALTKMAQESDAEFARLTGLVFDAVLAERERCAKIADDCDLSLCGYPNHEAKQFYESGVIDTSIIIAKAIRAPVSGSTEGGNG